MASITLAEASLLSQDMLVAGVIQNLITVNHFYQFLPFQGIKGNSLAYNRENVIGGSEWLGEGETIVEGKTPATFVKINTGLTTLIGDAEVGGMVKVTRSNINNQKAVQLASKAKSIGRQYQQKLITGTGQGNEIIGLAELVTDDQTIDTNTNGSALTFDLLDQLIDLVKDKDGDVDYIMMNSRTLRSFKQLLRLLGGASIGEVLKLPSGKSIPVYSDIPIFKNDYIPTNIVQGTNNNTTSIYAGTLDDGSKKIGISGLTAEESFGVSTEEVGISHDKDMEITRVKFYCGLALYNDKGLACIKGISN